MLHRKKGKTDAALRLTLWALVSALVFGRFDHGRTMLLALALAAGLPWMLCGLLPRWMLRTLAGLLAVLDLGALLLASLLYSIWGTSSPWSTAPESLADRQELFGGREVLVLAPHGDDELNLAGGVIEAYMDAGSRVTLAFTTNGDAQVDADIRAREVLSAAAALGIGADRVIFLGYDSGMAAGQPWLLEAVTPTRSLSGHTATHAVAGIAPWRTDSPYTRAAFTDDLCSLLTTLRPDVVISCLADAEIDHRTLAFCFEQAMGAALRQNPDWRPTVLGAYAYAAAWHAPDDYRSGALAASADSGELAALGQYRWAERLALPVAGRAVSILSADLTSTARALRCHISQDAAQRAPRLVNADKVFFPRRTDNLLLDAAMTVSSGDAEVLRDWVISDAKTVFPLEGNDPPLWVPDGEDEEKTVTFTFSEPVTIAALSFWDCPDPARNTGKVIVRFDTGLSVELSPDPTGKETGGTLSESVVCRGLSLTLTDGTGTDWGLCEFAVWPTPKASFPFFKMTDTAGNYLYDVLLPEGGVGTYSWIAHDMEPGELVFRADEPGCTVEWEGDSFTVELPEGQSCTVAVLDGDGRVLDSARFSNPVPRLRWILEHFDCIARCRAGAVFERCRELSHKLQITAWGRLRFV